MPTITMELSEYQERQDAIKALEERVARLEIDLEDARLGPAGTGVGALVEALNALLPVAQFAMANMAPRMYPGWPYEDLLRFARLLPDLSGAPASMREQANDLVLFAEDAKSWEEARANGTHEIKLMEENSRGSLDLPDELFGRDEE